MAAAPRVLTIPAGTPFLPALAAAILEGDLPVAGGSAPNRLELPRLTLLLPTRRACKAMLEAFLDVGGRNGTRALLLPRIRPIGGIDEDESFLRGLGDEGAGSAGALQVPPAIDPIERHLALTSLVMGWNAARLAHTASMDDAGLVRRDVEGDGVAHDGGLDVDVREATQVQRGHAEERARQGPQASSREPSGGA